MKSISIPLDSAQNQQYAISKIVSLGFDNKLRVVIEPDRKKRSKPQNALMWVSLLGDFSMQVDFDGKQYLPDVWNYQLKVKFLPNHPDPELTMPNYQKWEELPDGSTRLKGSTKHLTKLGMENYLHECYAYGAELGIRFTAKPGDF